MYCCTAGEGTSSYIYVSDHRRDSRKRFYYEQKECEEGEAGTGYHTAGDAKANIFVFDGGTGTCSTEEYPGEDDAETIFADRSSTPTGVGGGAEEAGDVDEDEYDGDASGVSEGGEYNGRAWAVRGGDGWR